MKFRKKPVVIEAWKYEPGMQIEGCDIRESVFLNGGAFILTLEGQMIASPGDWIIKGVKGEFYPCKPDIFEQTYEPAEESSHEDKPLRVSSDNECPQCEKWVGEKPCACIEAGEVEMSGEANDKPE